MDGADTELTLCSRTPTVGRPVSYQLHPQFTHMYRFVWTAQKQAAEKLNICRDLYGQHRNKQRRN